jgi:hypothetical protein
MESPNFDNPREREREREPLLLVCMTDFIHESQRELFDVELKNHERVIPVRLHLILSTMVRSCVAFDSWQEVVEVHGNCLRGGGRYVGRTGASGNRSPRGASG